MALKYAVNNSLSAITSLPSGISGGALNLISTQTASSSASLEFSIDGTYDSYVFKLINIHIANDTSKFGFNFSTDGGSNYNVIKTTTLAPQAYHQESDTAAALQYDDGDDIAQGTGLQPIIGTGLGNLNDENLCAEIFLYNPSSTTFVKHFISKGITNAAIDYAFNSYAAGYCNTTSAVNAVQFKAESGNIDDGIIKMYGVS